MESKKTLLGEPHVAWSVHVCNGKLERVLKIPFASLISAPAPGPDGPAMPLGKVESAC
jgi:hypothetical protein